MSKIQRLVTATLVLFISIHVPVLAEIIYTKDGEVIKGDIVREDAQSIYVKTKYQTRQIQRRFIKRILYGDRDMEPIYIVMKDGSTIKGFLIDQDAKNVYMRKDKNSSDEITILKSQIKQMSQGRLIPLKPAVSARVGMFMPLNTSGADLKLSFLFLGNISFNPTLLEGLRLEIEGGYTQSEGKGTNGQYFRIIPITAGLNYTVPVFSINIIPRAAAGISILEFNDGEGSTFRGVDFTISTGLGIGYEFMKNTLAVSVWSDYFVIIEGKNTMNSVAFTMGVHYYF